MSAVQLKLTNPKHGATGDVYVRTSSVLVGREHAPGKWKLITKVTTLWLDASLPQMRGAFGSVPYIECKDAETGLAVLIRRSAISVASPRRDGKVRLSLEGECVTVEPNIELDEYLDALVARASEEQE